MPVKLNNILSPLPVATIILIISSTLPGTAPASDLTREQRLAEQTVDAILDGKPVMLAAAICRNRAYNALC